MNVVHYLPGTSCVAYFWQMFNPFLSVFNFLSSCLRSACDSADSPAMVETSSEDISPTFMGVNIVHMSPIKSPSITCKATLSMKVLSATWNPS